MVGFYQDTKHLAQGVYDCLKTVNNNYTLRPFNRLDMDRSMWWIIPSKEFPAYKYGKYFIYENSDGTY